MKLGFSSLCCPTWTLDSIIDVAAGMGFQGFELRGLRGQLDLTRIPELNGEQERLTGRLTEAGVELVCLGTSASFTAKKGRDLEANKDLARRHIELAGRLGCPMVRVFSGDAPRGVGPAAALANASAALRELAPIAARNRVTLVVENVGDLARSEDLWYLMDAADHPAIQCCWNPVNGLCLGERPTISVPRLGKRLKLVHLCDAKLDGQGNLDRFVEPGAGEVDIDRLINLLRGIGFDGYLLFEWPKLWIDDLAEPDKILPRFKEVVSSIIDAERKPLTAYKADKNAPKFRKRAASS